MALLTSSCSVGPDYVRPELDLPDAWNATPRATRITAVQETARWWRYLRDPLLDDLIERAERSSPTVKAALHRIEETRASYGLTRGEYWPDIDGVGAFRRLRASRNGTNNRVAGFQFEDRNLWSVGAELTWEIDLWGRVRRAVEAGHAELEASVENYRDVLVVLQAEIVRHYVELRSMQERLAILDRNIELQERALSIAESKQKAGVVSSLDVDQSAASLGMTRSRRPQLRARAAVLMHRLGVLVGDGPAALVDLLARPDRVPETPAILRTPMPRDLLRQRPDIRRAERQLAAATARIGVRTADLYPRFTLFGSVSWESIEAGDLLDKDSLGFSFGPSFRWNLFEGGRVRSAIEIEDERTEQAFFAYKDSVLRALADVEDALVQNRENRERVSILESAGTSASSAMDAVLESYEAGVSDLARVLEAQGVLASVEDAAAQSRAELALSYVQLYRAFGGGWIHPGDEEAKLHRDAPQPRDADASTRP